MRRIPESACLYYYNVLRKWWCLLIMWGGRSFPRRVPNSADGEQGRADPTHLESGSAASSPLGPLPHGAKPLPAWPWHPSTSAELGYWLCQNSVFPGQDRGRRTLSLESSLFMGRILKTEHPMVTSASLDICYTDTLFWGILWLKFCQRKWHSLWRRQRSFPGGIIISR